MTCCTTTLIPFVSESSTTVPYTGNKPTVTVSYLVEGVWYAIGVVSGIIYGAASVTVEHGGPNTGVIKMVQ